MGGRPGEQPQRAQGGIQRLENSLVTSEKPHLEPMVVLGSVGPPGPRLGKCPGQMHGANLLVPMASCKLSHKDYPLKTTPRSPPHEDPPPMKNTP